MWGVGLNIGAINGYAFTDLGGRSIGSLRCCFALIYTLLLLFCSSFLFPSSLRAEEIIPQITRPDTDIVIDIDTPVFTREVDQYSDPVLESFFSLTKKPSEIIEERFRLHKERVAKRGNERPLLEIYSGGDGREGDRGFYAGGVMGPLDKHLNLKGLRLRASYGKSFSEYYSKYPIFNDKTFDPHFKSQSKFFEGLIGYEFRFQKSIFKVYGGVLHEKRSFDKKHLQTQIENTKEHYKDTEVQDGGSKILLTSETIDKVGKELTKQIYKDHQDTETGAKFLIEVWHDFENHNWFSGYASYSTASDFYAVHGRYGLPLIYNIDFGAEISFYGNDYQDLMRTGLFTRIKDMDGEWMFSIGLEDDASDLDSSSFRNENLYVTLQYFQRLYLSELSEGLFFP